MKFRIGLLIPIVLFWCLSARADMPYNQYWTKANSFYKQRNFDSSVYYYEKIAELKPANAELYYNLGNAYYRSNNVAQAILNYKRALKLQPGYKNAQDNLLLAQSRTAIKAPYSKDVFFIAWWKNITGPATSQGWAITSLVIFLLLISLLFRFRWKKLHGQMQRSVLFTGTAIFLLALLAAFASADKRSSNDEAVVMSPDAIFKKEIKGTRSEMLPEGTIVVCEVSEGQWTEVRLADGREGWVRTESIERI